MTERKKGRKGKKWISLDNMLGKALCILLVVILTVGAFLAPKMINNLYDAGTLMQITYVDLDLSTYVVAYTSFPEKIEAIARAKAAGEELAVLSSGDAEEKISDEDLVDVTNGEMEKLRDSSVMLFWEEWWSGLTKENLVSREKSTLYTQPGEGQDSAPGSEMAPVQFWTLTFEPTTDQKAEAEEYRLMLEEKDVSVMTWPPFEYAAQKLIICLDADFYKIYAVGIEGPEDKIWMQYEMYGWEFPNIFGNTFVSKSGEKYVEAVPDYILELQIYLTDSFLADWSEYWGVYRKDENIYEVDTPGEIIGYMAFLNEKSEAEENRYADPGVENDYAEQSDDDEILLAVGCSGQWDGEDNELWIQRAGCKEFFEMMQF